MWSRWPRPSAAQDLQLAFYAEAKKRGYAAGEFRVPKILAGPDAVAEVAAWPCDVVLNGVTGAAGLAPRWPPWTPAGRWRWPTRSR